MIEVQKLSRVGELCMVRGCIGLGVPEERKNQVRKD